MPKATEKTTRKSRATKADGGKKKKGKFLPLTEQF